MNSIFELDSDYKTFVHELKSRVKTARLQAVLSVNLAQIQLYWEIGKGIIEQQAKRQWGSKIIEQIARDLSTAFPDMKGFSRSNIYNMQKFAAAYPNAEFVQQAVGQLPWGHLVVLIEKVKEPIEREWYAEQSQEQGWARAALVRQINNNVYPRQSKLAIKTTNFLKRLPKEQSDLLNEMIKEPYDFGFMPVQSGAKEREIELGLIKHVKELLLELGAGFAFVSSQYPLEVGGENFYIDLLFFCIPLDAYFIIEIKTGKFKPAYAGQLNFYLSVVDDTLKKSHHNPSIGLLLCEEKNKIVAEYALNRIETPMGISEYRLSKHVPDKLKKLLPSIELLEDKLKDNIDKQQSLDKI